LGRASGGWWAAAARVELRSGPSGGEGVVALGASSGGDGVVAQKASGNR
jgi:hypothetical protein